MQNKFWTKEQHIQRKSNKPRTKGHSYAPPYPKSCGDPAETESRRRNTWRGGGDMSKQEANPHPPNPKPQVNNFYQDTCKRHNPGTQPHERISWKGNKFGSESSGSTRTRRIPLSFSLSLSPPPIKTLSLSLWGKIEGKEMVALLLLVLKHDDEAASSDPRLPSSALRLFLPNMH